MGLIQTVYLLHYTATTNAMFKYKPNISVTSYLMRLTDCHLDQPPSMTC